MSSSPSVIDTLATTQRFLTICAYPIWITFGIIGCLLNLVIFSRPHLRTTSCSIYFFAASVDHLMTLIVGIGPVLYTLGAPNPQLHSIVFCKIRGYLFQICLMLSRWFVAFACIDRYGLTSEKTHLRNFSKSKVAYRAIIVITIFWSIICTHRLIFYEIYGKVCGIVNNMIAAFYHSFYVIIGGGVLPATIMILCAWLIRRNLASRHQIRARLALGDRGKRKLDQQVHKILFAQVFCYIIFTIPQLCNLVFSTISITIPHRSSEHLAIEAFVAFIAEFMLYLFPVTSFYLYTLTSRTFRKDLMQFFRSLIDRNRRIMPGLSTTVTCNNIEHRQTTMIG
ncbi:unnamed protein product [Rotaria socialis]|uniref:G-protein coupled receptors family 1 profile domain-containing protein n=1 Tax=Rotaria socialis TaxID=392032 RepID=A0A821R583_9BILA|nr:unnamed protein product [Rotaria socialis]CAF3457686.1 unnamed protein product [Rotaria socialis]CAF4642461.1 unnamed protein product [Rotaria socialis]CAF4836421.1 unnamed protein product [Rotaria socialis]